MKPITRCQEFLSGVSVSASARLCEIPPARLYAFISGMDSLEERRSRNYVMHPFSDT